MKYRLELDLYSRGDWHTAADPDEETYDTLEAAEQRIMFLEGLEREIAGDLYAKNGTPFARYRIVPIPEGAHEVQ